MCGINGIYSLTGMVDPKWTKQMTDILRHRGPDDEGYLFINTRTGIFEERSGDATVEELKSRLQHINNVTHSYNLAFGHRRLSIIDLSYLGHQPMPYDNEKYWIIYNGEIFNYVELRDELKRSGFNFKTNSDTEVILASYFRWGFDCVKHFNGDWAFCIYDKTKDILFASRDRFGVRFFYYFWDGETFAFASEIKALLSLPWIGKNLDSRQIYDFLIFGLMDHTDKTLYEKILQLKPGHNLVLYLNKKDLKTLNYYNLSFNPDLGRYDQRQAFTFANEIKDLLYDSVKIRLRSDVPVGSCLSGGLDSSTIVIMVNKLIKEQRISNTNIGDRQKTFTASYMNDPVDESNHAREIIERTGVDGKFVYPDGMRLWDELDDLLYQQDQPFGTTSIYAQWNVMRLASSHVKVVLDGQGGDELLGGYLGYPPFAISQGNIRLFLQRLRLYGTIAFKELYFALGFRFAPTSLKDKLFFFSRKSFLKFLKITFPQFSEPMPNIREIIHDVVRPNLNLRLWQDLTKYSIPQLLHYEDRNGMAFSLESRVPYLDYRLVDYVMDIPAIYKIYNGWTKYIFRIAVKDILPETILWRKDKLGFSTPEKKWLLNGENPFKSFVDRYHIPYDGDYFWWRLFLTFYWMKQRGMA
jgi:asparagine synthase (glutamine-hydrolysing)